MTLFLTLGLVGLAVIALSLLAGDLLGGALHALEGDWISTAAIGGFVSAFGFGAAAADGAGLPTAGACAIGVAAGVLVGWFAWWLTRLVKNGPSDDTVTVADSVGRTGRVVTAIPEQGYGVVRIAVGGHTLTYNAVSAAAIEAGTEVTVTDVLSPSAVRVTAVWQPGS